MGALLFGALLACLVKLFSCETHGRLAHRPYPLTFLRIRVAVGNRIQRAQRIGAYRVHPVAARWQAPIQPVHGLTRRLLVALPSAGHDSEPHNNHYPSHPKTVARGQ